MDTGKSPTYLFGENNDKVGADCGNCDGRHTCPVYASIVLPVIKGSMEAEELPIGDGLLTHWETIRDGEDTEGGQYGAGGIYSAVKALVDGRYNLDDETNNSIPEFIADLMVEMSS